LVQPPSIVLPGPSPSLSTSWLALLGFGLFKDHRRWRNQEWLDPYLLASHLVGNHLQANGSRSLSREASQNQQRKQCPSHASPNKWCILLTKYTGFLVPQMLASPQRHRSLGNHAEVRPVNEMPGQVADDAPPCSLNIFPRQYLYSPLLHDKREPSCSIRQLFLRLPGPEYLQNEPSC